MFFSKKKKIERDEETIKELMAELKELRKEYESEIFQHAYYAGKLQAYEDMGFLNNAIEEIDISDIVNT